MLNFWADLWADTEVCPYKLISTEILNILNTIGRMIMVEVV
jgi:hypothetical protein